MMNIFAWILLVFLASSNSLYAETGPQVQEAAADARDNERQDAFAEAWNDESIDEAVLLALKNGSTPDAILQQGINLYEINPQNVIRAMYCAGINGEHIEESALNYGLTKEIVSAGYKKSVDECREILVDSQGYIPASAGVNFGQPEPPPSTPARPVSPAKPPGKPASPSTF